tara:strand:- start:1095 stop:1634 length:540 start_codon:yes stop_codon:yes gene_type:complete
VNGAYKIEYAELLKRSRWKLIEAVWLLHGIFVKPEEGFGHKMEKFFFNTIVEQCDDSLEIGRLPETFLSQMLSWDITEVIHTIRISDWKELPKNWQRKIEMRKSISYFWNLLNAKANIKKCEVCYIDSNGKWYALAPESMWNAEYLLAFAQEAGIDTNWLVDDIKKHRRVPSKNAIVAG